MSSALHRKGQSTSTAPLVVESMVSGDRADVGGVLCNDVAGMCLLSHGHMKSNSESGVYTSLVRLASQLSPLQRESVNSNQPVPLVTIECDATAVLVKEYDGHTVALRVPKSQQPSNEMQD